MYQGISANIAGDVAIGDATYKFKFEGDRLTIDGVDLGIAMTILTLASADAEVAPPQKARRGRPRKSSPKGAVVSRAPEPAVEPEPVVEVEPEPAPKRARRKKAEPAPVVEPEAEAEPEPVVEVEASMPAPAPTEPEPVEAPKPEPKAEPKPEPVKAPSNGEPPRWLTTSSSLREAVVAAMEEGGAGSDAVAITALLAPHKDACPFMARLPNAEAVEARVGRVLATLA